MVTMHFYMHKIYKKSINTTSVFVSPKNNGDVDIGDFRPIKLLGSVEKMIPKCLLQD